MAASLEMFNCVERAYHAVFMKAEPPISAAEISALPAVDFMLALLRGHAGWREKRMMVDEPLDDPRRCDPLTVVQRHAERLPRVKALQHVHVVGQSGAPARLPHDVIVPRGPCPL